MSIKSAGSTLRVATTNDMIHWKKSVEFSVEEKDAHSGLLNLHMFYDGNVVEDRVIQSDEIDHSGNDIAVAMDILTNMNLPVGTKFKLKIEFTLPENGGNNICR